MNIKLVAIGTGAGKVLKHINTSILESADVVAIDTDREALNSVAAGSNVYIDFEAQYKMDSPEYQSELEALKTALGTKITQITASLKGSERAVVLCCLGSRAGLVLAPEILRTIKELNIPTTAIVSKPLSFEGSLRAENAQQSLASIKGLADAVIVLDNESLEFPANASGADVFDILDKELAKVAQEKLVLP